MRPLDGLASLREGRFFVVIAQRSFPLEEKNVGVISFLLNEIRLFIVFKTRIFLCRSIALKIFEILFCAVMVELARRP